MNLYKGYKGFLANSSNFPVNMKLLQNKNIIYSVKLNLLVIA